MFSVAKWYLRSRYLPLILFIFSLFVPFLFAALLETNLFFLISSIIVLITTGIVLYPWEIGSVKRNTNRWHTFTGAISHHLGQKLDIVTEGTSHIITIEDVPHVPFSNMRVIHKRSVTNIRKVLTLQNIASHTIISPQNLPLKVDQSGNFNMFYGEVYMDAVTLFQAEAVLREPAYLKKMDLKDDDSKQYPLRAYIFRALTVNKGEDFARLKFFYENQITPQVLATTASLPDNEYEDVAILPPSWIQELLNQEIVFLSNYPFVYDDKNTIKEILVN